MSEKKKNDDKKIVEITSANLVNETVQKFGGAVKEHLVAYSGQNNETGQTLVKGLKSVSEQKINADYKFQNVHQQAGFAAEIKEVANVNAEKIIKGSSDRKIRTDDLGRVNDQLFDHVEIDAEGNIIKGTGSQMKFIGASSKDPFGWHAPERALEKLQSKKYDKYFENNIKIEVPSDHYEKIIDAADKRIDILTKQLENRIKAQDNEIADNLSDEIARLEKIKTNLSKSTVSSKEAVFARMHPKLSTAKSIANISNRAGLESAKYSSILGGGLSIINNTIAAVNGDVEPEEALANVAKDTVVASVSGYEIGFAGSAMKGVMQNSTNTYIRTLSNTNLPGTLVAVTIGAAKTMKRYYEGEIDGVECFEELGAQGVETISSAMFAVVGQAAIPIPIVGAAIGSMLGYAVASASYGTLLSSLKDAKIAREEREAIEKACQEHITLIRQYRTEIENVINEYLVTNMSLFHDTFSEIKHVLDIGDIDKLISEANCVKEKLGKEAQYDSFDEFTQIMESDTPFKL